MFETRLTPILTFDMEKLSKTIAILLSGLLVQPALGQSTACIDSTQIVPDLICTLIYAPVCGCNGVTYENACVAELGAGVTSWEVGECPQVESCMDLAGVDFGDCDFVLGIAQVNGVCMTISGCDWVVNGIDYSAAFFNDEPTCTMCNEVPPDCGLQLVTTTSDGMWYTFSAIDVPMGVELEWYIDGWLAQSGGATFEAGFDFNPNWTVCAQYVSDPCGGMVEACYSNLEGVAPCTDLAGVDFGLCEMALGVARVDGLCQYVSGCGSYVGGVNYAGAFFQSVEDCLLNCATECVDNQLLELGQTIDCTTEYLPVCGCDGVTYGNACEAMYGGGVTSWTDGSCPDIPGCMYLAACNFDPEATMDDGSCLFPPQDCSWPEGGGCTYPEGNNFDPNAIFDDGSCVFYLVSPCPGDMDGDGSVTVGDLLNILGLFGAVC